MPYSYSSLCAYLKDNGIAADDAREEALLLLEAFCGVGRADCLCNRNQVYESQALDTAVQKRGERYPLQYILGKWDFYGLTFKVNEHCLIPRPDTELLVETAIRKLPQGATFVDLCTGSGCIAIAILAHRPDTKAIAVELFPETLALAEKNARINGVSDRLISIQADVLQEGCDQLQAYAPVQAVLSNPPYIPRKEVDGLAPELFFEPRVALDGGEDGLIFYRAILEKYPTLLAPHGQIIMEIGYDQGEALKVLGKIYLPHMTCTCLKDLGGQDRVVLFDTSDSPHA